jgi:NADPH:quinone reductase-like Zn-dependent oxidoreductase
MKAVIVREHGGLDALLLEDLPTPEPGPGQVRVRVEACAVNHLDLWVRKGVPGARFPLPLIPGNDVAGTVDALGPGVEDLRVGAEIVVQPGLSCGHCEACFGGRDHHCRSYGILGEHRHGGYAQFVVVPRANIAPKPAQLGFAEAAAMPLTFLTAWTMLVDRAKLQTGEWVLVQAAGSGVSSAAIQIAALHQARIIATAGSEAKLQKAKELGAEFTLDHRAVDVTREVRAITSGRGVDVVVDHVGAETFEAGLRSLAWQGRFVTCGATTGAEARVNLRHLFFKSLSILGSTMGPKSTVLRVLELAERGLLKPVIDRKLPLAQAAEAHRLIEERQVFGKVVLIPWNEGTTT